MRPPSARRGRRDGRPRLRPRVFGTASTAAAIGVKQAMASGAIKGTVKLFGTPAEETGIGKVYMLREGLFKDVDAILSWHAGDSTAAVWDYSKAIVSVKFRFKGLPAHASTSPHQGKSALDAVELMNVGVNYMREHVKEDTRIHYVITNGGGQPNVVPPLGRGLVLPARQQAHGRRGVLRLDASRSRARPRR